jgi:hypothetical protein
MMLLKGMFAMFRNTTAHAPVARKFALRLHLSEPQFVRASSEC